jgi:hypothetical protein
MTEMDDTSKIITIAAVLMTLWVVLGGLGIVVKEMWRAWGDKRK